MQDQFVGFIVGMLAHDKRVGEHRGTRRHERPSLWFFIDYALELSPTRRLPAPSKGEM